MKLDRQLLFERAWREFNIMTKHKCQTNLSECLKRQYKVAKMVGYQNYWAIPGELSDRRLKMIRYVQKRKR